MNLNKHFLKQAGLFLLFVIGFWSIASWYLAPPSDGMVLKQGDMQQVRLMRYAAEQVKETTGTLPQWNDRLFSGMPGSLITGIEQGSLLLKYKVIELFGLVKSPFNFLFVAMLSMFVLLLSVRVDRWLAAAGAIGYAFMTFSISSYEAGHITKVLAMGAMPGVIGGLALLSQRRYLMGAAVTALFFGMVVNYFHYQIAYYAGIMVGLYFLVELVSAIRSKDLKHFAMSTSIAVVSMGLAVLTCVGKLADTNDYAKATMRGGSAVAEATAAKGAQVGKTGLDMDYAFSWSYGIDETFTLLVPGFKGGSSNEMVNDADFGETRLPLYFGDLQFTSGPVYLGATLVFLFVFGLMLAFVWKKDKPEDAQAQLNFNWAVFGLITFLVSVILGWGRHFFINEFLFNNLPYYNKFRTPMMALVIAQVVVPMIGLLGLYRFIVLIQHNGLSEVAQKKVFKNTLILAGALVGAVVLITWSSDFAALETDKRIAEQGGMETVNKIKELRSKLVWDDIFRSIMFIGALVGLVYVALKKQASTLVAGLVVIVLVGFDMVGVSKRYLTDDNWEDKETEEAILPSTIDNQIIANNKDGKRVIDYRGGINGAFNDNRAGAFHRNVGGYHPAKMSRYQDVMSHCIGSSGPTGSGDLMNNPALDMLNCGFIMGISQDGKSEIVVPRMTALGHAWFVDSVIEGATAKDALTLINTQNLRKNAVIEANDYKSGAATGFVLGARTFSKDSVASIGRVFYSNDSIAYESNNGNSGCAVFSEIYYNEKNGAWKAYIDGKEAKALRVNYILRGLEIPAGKHAVTWVYEPADRSTMVNIEWASSALILLLVVGSLVQLLLKKDELEG
ncbi:MAG: hypothetical protein ACKO67_02740 [Bacteroidota bacterium]